KSFGVNCRGWGLSKTGRLRYSQQMQDNALRFGYRPPIALLEWMMGFPENHTHIERAVLATLSCRPLPNGSQSESISSIKSYGVTLTSTGLAFERDLNFEEWERAGSEIFRVQQAWQWWVGDWINYGERKYGETYKAAIAVTGRSSQSLMNVALIAR